MFVAALERAIAFTRPIHSIVRFYRSSEIQPGAATLFFVNADGWALTCRHVAQQLAASDQLLAKFNDFKTKRVAIKGQKKEKNLLREVERQFGFGPRTVVEVYNNFMNCVDGPLQAEMKLHPELDVALIRFLNYKTLLCANFPVFAKNDADLKQGKFLCRLGFPFPEFTNFAYDLASDKIHWTTSGRIDTPTFPIEGMVTRHLLGPGGAVVGFELSTPGLRGQSGGPAFDVDGRVWGMQSGTNHLDLDFDVDMQVVRNGQKTNIKNHAVLHVGHCLHVSELKQFMRLHSVQFQEG